MANLIYKSTTVYKTVTGTDSVQFVGTLSSNLLRIENHLKNLHVVQASSEHEPMKLNVSEQFESIFNNK